MATWRYGLRWPRATLGDDANARTESARRAATRSNSPIFRRFTMYRPCYAYRATWPVARRSPRSEARPTAQSPEQHPVYEACDSCGRRDRPAGPSVGLVVRPGMPRPRYQRADAAAGQTEDQVDPQVRGHGGENVSHQERVHVRGAAGGVLVLIVGAARKDVQGTEGHHGAEAEHQQPAGQAGEHACAQGGAGGPVRERRDRAGGQGDQNREQVEQAACELFTRMAELGRAARPDLTRP